MDSTPAPPPAFPRNPVLVRVWRGAHVESQHRGAWALVDAQGQVVEGAGAFDEPFFARSAIKSIQALPLLEGGAAERFGIDDLELALALSSHNAEELHTRGVTGLLERLGLDVSHLRCGAQTPGDPTARAALAESGEKATALHNNCSGKHAAFLAQALHLGVDPANYLDPSCAVQSRVRAVVAELTDLDADGLETAVDGCSAPTYRLPLGALALAFARIASPDGLDAERRLACQRMLRAVERHPRAIAGRHKRLCTELAEVGRGELFPKIGAEAVYAVGIVGTGRALAVKMDDGGPRGLHATVIHLLARFGYLKTEQLDRLAKWRPQVLTNWAGLEVGRLEVVPEGVSEPVSGPVSEPSRFPRTAREGSEG